MTENNNSQILGIIVTLVTIILCGLPGLVSLCSGVILVFNNWFVDNPAAAYLAILSLLCTGIFFVAIPVAAGILTYLVRSEDNELLAKDEHIPPPS